MGRTHHDHRLILSEGSLKSRFLDPETFLDLGHLEVLDGDTRAENLNEMDFGQARCTPTFCRRIESSHPGPDRGQVTGWIDLVELRPRPQELCIRNELAVPATLRVAGCL